MVRRAALKADRERFTAAGSYVPSSFQRPVVMLQRDTCPFSESGTGRSEGNGTLRPFDQHRTDNFLETLNLTAQGRLRNAES
jgi:hypothetical protein